MSTRSSSKLPISPSDIAHECFCLGLKRAARAVARRYDEAFLPFELNNGQFSMLTSIAGLQPIGVQALGEQLAMDRTTVTAALKPLQRRGLVDVEVSSTDPRRRDVALTNDGRDVLAQAMPVWRSLQEEVAGAFSASGQAQLRRHLARLG